MSEVKSKIIIPKRATKTKLASSESVLKEGEIALIYPDTGPGTGAAKLVSGDGATVAKNLPIAIDGEAIDELKNSLDIAKKIIPITLSLTGWKSANGDNSAPYVQTVINEELKSSMNPDLVSMLDESATPEEQEAYNKNLAIISQGVGTVNNGSITYKVYKLPSADITIGLTRLGGVKEVETASGVDDVKVGGISVVNNKIAEIPKVDTSNLVPYSGASKDIDVGDHAINFNTTGAIGDLAATAIINAGKFTGGTYTIPGVYIETEANGTNPYLRDHFSLSVEPTGLLINADHDGDTGNNSTSFAVSTDGFNVRAGLDHQVNITPDKVTGLALPTANSDAANKQYVNLVSGGRALRQLPVKSIPKSSSLTLTIPLTLPPSPVNGYAARVLSITILNNEETPESMNYNYGLNTRDELFITYFNNDSTTDKTPTDKMAIIHYAYVPRNV